MRAFFAPAATRRAATLLDTPPPALYTASADGALFAYTCTCEDTGVAPGYTNRLTEDAQLAGSAHGEAGELQVIADDDSVPSASVAQPSARKRARPNNSAQDDMVAVDAERRREAALEASVSTSAFADGKWRLAERHFFNQNHTKLTAADFHAASGLLVTAYSNGAFLLHQLPAFEHLQTLSLAQQPISAARFNATGEWIALGCAALGQLLVWEWRSETYVLKQQVRCGSQYLHAGSAK